MPIEPRDYLADLYAPLAHIVGTGTGSGDLPPKLQVGWLDGTDSRRLAAYRVLEAYRTNTRRYWLGAQLWDRTYEVDERSGNLRTIGQSAAEAYREYGDAMLLVQTARSILLGDSQTVAVEGADVARSREAEALAWLQDWADRVRIDAKVLEGEEHSIGDGDGVYALGWSARTGRPWLRTYDPGFYFPDWSSVEDPYYADWADEESPPVQHLAWEVDRGGETILRRTTWRMTRLVDARGLVTTRPVPWSDTPTEWACVYSVSEWATKDLHESANIYTLTGGVPVVPAVDMGVDFLPVVHVPNDTPGERHFGRSLLLNVAQLLDDLSGADTDLSVDAELVASPPAAFTGTDGTRMGAGPGTQWNVPEGASAAYVDTSRNLDALIKYVTQVLDRLAKNSRIGNVVLGEVKPNEVPSGYALRLGFASAEALVREMRVVRDSKYALLLKFALRLAQANQVLPAGPTPTARLVLGASMPSDRAAAILEVTGLLKEHAISIQTGVRMLQEAGLPIEDAAAEVAAIRAGLFAEAVQLVEATGDVAAAARMLGLPPVTAPPPAG